MSLTEHEMVMTVSPALEAEVVLDTTLRDLYALDNPDDTAIMLVNAIPTAEVQMIDAIPLSTRFAYQSPNVLTKDSDFLARLYLQVVPQLFGFIAGNMPLVLFDLDRVPDRTHRDHAHRMPPELSAAFASPVKLQLVRCCDSVLYAQVVEFIRANALDTTNANGVRDVDAAELTLIHAASSFVAYGTGTCRRIPVVAAVFLVGTSPRRRKSLVRWGVVLNPSFVLVDGDDLERIERVVDTGLGRMGDVDGGIK
ncbi:MAG: hypothetical protein Q9168_003218 [Polycauliona sp. 1 TL-2023]